MKEFRNFKLRRQIAFLIGIAIVLIVMISFLSYINLYYTMKKKAKDYTTSSINQLEDNLRIIKKDIKNVGNLIAYNRVVQEFLTYDEPLYKVRLNNFIENMFNYIASLNDSIIDIAIIKKKGSLSSFFLHIDYHDYMKLEEQYKITSKDFTKPMFVTDMENGRDHLFYIMPIFNIYDSSYVENKIGTIIIYFNINDIRSLIKKLAISDKTFFGITDQNDRIITSNLEEEEGNLFEKYGYYIGSEDRMPIIQKKYISDLNWNVISIIPTKEVTKELSFFRLLILIIGLIMVVLLLAIGFVINRNITSPISTMVDSINKIGDEHLKQYITTPIAEEVKGIKHQIDLDLEGEIGFIAKNINRMLYKIETITQENIKSQKNLYEMKLHKKQAQISALQSQINPHFLYNTLECMRSIGYVYQVEEIIDISTAMAEIFRYSIKGANFVNISDEIEIIEEYLKIMNIRFRGKFVIDLEIEEELLDRKMPKMILQPIVENAIYHGLESKEGRGKLTIEGISTQENIIFKIKDNGIGIAADELKVLKDYLKGEFEDDIHTSQKRSIGMLNINRKIKLFFGKEYGLEVDSKKDVGTEVIIRLPS
ncbi:two-component system sensor histidine kinase YesM [Orenia metallireducens]|uniref:sensor histidine kinase n=1 Tax=Orenia metallireducens TaxID=1413210 RepID=UPI000D41CEA4|nr:histidine kinase [Orenia metallireducens]PRX35617.1 two-component system sensor histidine kinase YesM [Orenia metallireducens]